MNNIPLVLSCFMNNFQHRVLTNMDSSGFGVRLDNRLSSYIPPHWHREAELLLFIKGHVTCNIESTSLHFKRGDLFLINSLQVHETRCSRDAEYLVVHIAPEQMCLFMPTFDQLSFRLSFQPEQQEKAAAYEQLKKHMEQILHLTRQTNPDAVLERESHLFAVAALLVRHFSQSLAVEETKLQRSDMLRLEPVMEYVNLHFAEELSLDEAANLMGLNREYFCRLFKKNMGVSFLQYVYQVRTTAVCRELETTEDPIGDIAQRNGFRDPKMLNQYFKEIYGCTPSEKRKAFREVTLEDWEETV